MKHPEGHDTSQSCSCTSCVYKRGSDHPSVKRMLIQGSKIDKLYLGKYIPLRERKLLDRLVRTRAVYDDIRNQLLSGSSTSIQEKANLKPRKHSSTRRSIDDSDNISGDIVELVDMVDEGKVLEHKNKDLNDCCNCCSCGEVQSHAHQSKRRHRYAHGHPHSGQYTMSGTSMISRRGLSDDGRRRGVRFKPKHISSEPCTCSSKIRDMVKRHSHEIIRKLRSERPKSLLEQPSDLTVDTTIKKDPRLKKSYQKIKRSKTRLMQSMGEGARKIKKSKTTIKEHVEARTRESIEKLKIARDRVKASLDTAVESINQTAFQIKKDSIAKFKEKLEKKRRRHLNKYIPCEISCHPEECDPEECFKIINRRHRKRLKTYVKKVPDQDQPTAADKQKTSINKKASGSKQPNVINETAEKQQKTTTQTQDPNVKAEVTNTASKGFEQEIIIRSKSGKILKYEKVIHKSPGQAKVSLDIKNKAGEHQVEVSELQQKAQLNEGQKSNVPKGKVSCRCIPERKKTSVKSAPGLPPVSPQLISISVSRSKRKKLNPSPEAVRHSGAHSLKRCFCTLKLKPKSVRQSKASKSASRNTTTATQSKPTLNLNPSKVRVLERTPMKDLSRKTNTCPTGICEECDPTECEKRRKMRTLRHGSSQGITRSKTKSVSTIPSKTVSNASSEGVTPYSSKTGVHEIVEGTESQKQVVRIQSTFSSNKEFNKEKTAPSALEEPIQEKTKASKNAKRSHGSHKKIHLPHRHSQISTSAAKSKYTLTKHGLRRCFCTLKLANPEKTKSSKGSQSSLNEVKDVANAKSQVETRIIATEKKEKMAKVRYKLLPNECEPGVCVPGECDPYHCLQLINKRVPKHHMKQSSTDQRRTKSTSSVISRNVSNKSKKVQSSVFSVKTIKKKKRTLQHSNTTSNIPDRQLVRIGSTFSFNIEFYKDKKIDKKSPVSSISNISGREFGKKSEKISKTKKTKLKERSYQNKIKQQQKSTSTLITRKNKGSFIAPSMKRCFCTIKLQTKSAKGIDLNETVTVGTKTPESNRDIYKNIMLTKGTKTKPEKLKIRPVLGPYECEPYVCVPGECDPYQCLELIKKRKPQHKNLAIVTDQTKMKSKSNITYKSTLRSKGASARSKLRRSKEVHSSIHPVKNKKSLSPKLVQKIDHRQAVRLGSDFSFSIEFSKNKSYTSAEEAKPKVFRESSNEKSVRRLRNKEAIAKSDNSSRDTQVTHTKKDFKSTGIRPMLKRCFCTLKLQGNQNQQTKTKTPKDRGFDVKQQRIYTVSRITVSKAIPHVDDNIQQIETLHDSVLPRNGLRLDALSISSTFINYDVTKSFVLSHCDMKSYSSNCRLPSTKPPCESADNKSNIILPRMFNKGSEKCLSSESCLLSGTEYKSKNYSRNELKELVSTRYLCDSSLQLTGASQLLHRRYCTMNFQVSKNKRYLHKLKPYECKPGVCVPDECDPYECQKLIMKRFNKKVSRMSGTNIKSRSMSSLANHYTSSLTKKIQSRQPHEKVNKTRVSGITYKALPSQHQQPKHTAKQAVRVGSSCSFNVEFSKHRTTSKNILPPRRAAPSKSAARSRLVSRSSKIKNKTLKTRGTKERGVSRHSQDSQSLIKTEHKGSPINTVMKRCFCTLKLQKKGKGQKQQKETLSTFHKGTDVPPNSLNGVVMVRAEASQFTIRPESVKLLPYECEPQVCVTGQCDPYECLERIKIRNKKTKDFGAGGTRSKKTAASMTGRRQVSTRTQSKQVAIPKIRRKQRANQKSIKTIDSRQSRSEPSAQQSRQAMSIGSNFSLNIEFFKENTNSKSDKDPSQRPVKVRPSVFTTEKTQRPQTKLKKPLYSNLGSTQKRNLKNMASQDLKTMDHRDLQIENSLKNASTITATLMKRCFCTSKLSMRKEKPQEKQALRMTDSIDSQIRDTKSILQRCFCLLKSKSIKKLKHAVVNAVTASDNDKAIPVVRAMNSPPENPRYQLDPYECEPGVCIPGECDPYECERLIKLQNKRLDLKYIETDILGTRSMSSSFDSSKTSQASRTGSSLKSRSNERKSHVKEVIRNQEPIRRATSDRFDIEFYKDRTLDADEVQAAARAIKKSKISKTKRRSLRTQNRILKTRDSGSAGLRIGSTDQQSQGMKSITKDSGVGPLLKRCFCTLKLQKQKQVEMLTQGTETPAFKETPTLYSKSVVTQGKKFKLKAYECEPNICIPYECDPYECEKLLKKRLMQDSNIGVITATHNKLGYKLEPYVCEPYTCVPGECDPYEQRIKLRNMKYKTSSTFTRKFKAKSMSSDIRYTASSKAQKVQAESVIKHVPRKITKSVSSKSYRSRRSNDSSRTESVRQSVRLGSGFSFDIKFYKDKDLKKEPVFKPRKRKQIHRSSTSYFVKSTTNRKMQHLRAVRDTDSREIRALKMQDGETGVSPLLKRCFCTLKLQKSEHMTSDQSMKMRYATGPRFNTISKNARNKSVYVVTFPNLLPYECEPGVCVPGACDPYECEKRIKRRFMHSQRAGTERPKRYASSSTAPGTRCKEMNCQAIAASPIQKQRRASSTKPVICDPVACDPQPVRTCDPQPVRTCDGDSSSVRLGSSFNFNIEFYKKSGGAVPRPCKPPSKPCQVTKPCQPCSPKMINKAVCRPQETTCKSVCSGRPQSRDYNLQTTMCKTQGTSISPLMKRCFCTLALQKNKCMSVCMKESLPVHKEISLGTRRHVLLDPNECEPNFCIPGQCDPYKCLERIKLRRLKESGTRTESPIHKYTSGVPCNDPICRSFGTQCNKQICQREIPTMTKPEKVLVEMPRIPCRASIPCGPTTKRTTRYGSNITFNIEFYKEQTDGTECEIARPCPTPTAAACTTSKPCPPVSSSVQQSTTNRKFRHRYSHANNRGNSQICQADCVKTATRGTGMGALLKRCFCTLNLRKSGASNSIKERRGKEKRFPQHKKKKTPIHQLNPAIETQRIKDKSNKKYSVSSRNSRKAGPNSRFNNVVTVNRLAMDNTWNYVFRTKPKLQSKCSESRQFTSKRPINNKRQDHPNKYEIENFIKQQANLIEMQTIYPYVTSKFNMNISKTTIIRHESMPKYSTKVNRDNQLEIFNRRRHTQEETQSCAKLNKKTEKKEIDYRDSRKSEPEKPHRKTLKKSLYFITLMLNMCTRIFFPSKRNKYLSAVYNRTQSIIIQEKNEIKRRRDKENKYFLKTSKSDRPAYLKVSNSSKTTISLKVPKIAEKRRKIYHDEAVLFQKRRIYSDFQCGDTAQNTILRNSHMHKSLVRLKYDEPYCSHAYLANFDNYKWKYPYACNKIVQMALVCPANKKLLQTKLFYENKTCKIGVETGDLGNTNNVILKGNQEEYLKAQFSSGDCFRDTAYYDENNKSVTAKSKIAKGGKKKGKEVEEAKSKNDLKNVKTQGTETKGDKVKSKKSEKDLQRCFCSLKGNQEKYLKAHLASGDCFRDIAHSEDNTKSVKDEGKIAKKGKLNSKAVEKATSEKEDVIANGNKAKGGKEKGMEDKEAKFKKYTKEVKAKGKKLKGCKANGKRGEDTNGKGKDIKGEETEDVKDTITKALPSSMRCKCEKANIAKQINKEQKRRSETKEKPKQKVITDRTRLGEQKIYKEKNKKVDKLKKKMQLKLDQFMNKQASKYEKSIDVMLAIIGR